MNKQLLAHAHVDGHDVSLDTMYIPVGEPGDKLDITEAISVVLYALEYHYDIVVPKMLTFRRFSSYVGSGGITLVGHHKTGSERDDLLVEIDFMWGVPLGKEEIE